MVLQLIYAISFYNTHKETGPTFDDRKKKGRNKRVESHKLNVYTAAATKILEVPKHKGGDEDAC